MLWENLLPGEFDEAVKRSKQLCIIPLGAMEVHGNHLPLGCDAFQGVEIVRRVAEQEDVVVFPGAPYFGDMSGALGGGNIAFPIAVIRDILEASCDACYQNGFRKILILTSHCGNQAMVNSFIREIYAKRKNYTVYHFHQNFPKVRDILDEREKYPYLTDEDVAVVQDFLDKGKINAHGGFIETAWIYHFYPELVQLDKFGELSGQSTHLFDEFERLKIKSPLVWPGNYPNAFEGDSHPGINARIARAYVEKTMETTAKAIHFLKEETISLECYAAYLEKARRHDKELENI